jgi:hypothetical protein
MAVRLILTLKCSEHPKYKGKRPPTTVCPGCYNLYDMRRPDYYDCWATIKEVQHGED